jgi:uncharacterized protein YcnI
MRSSVAAAGIAALATLGLMAGSGEARAHITLETQAAPVASIYKAVFRVPHGCAGAATTAIRVRIPEGVIAVKPMPKPGWALETVKGAYEKAYDYYGTPTTEGVREVAWSGGNLPDAFYDEFVMRVYLTGDLRPGTMLYFPVVQQCEQGVDRWIEIPAAGKGADDYETPAPGLRLEPRR